uniref:Bardet-Biedl syndrome 2 n=1 Tax=Timema shepardi TaxID=629360 RepID=A0A7R9AQS2_TIMSH|nr:unnamed protein product [Timema shepardi]
MEPLLDADSHALSTAPNTKQNVIITPKLADLDIHQPGRSIGRTVLARQQDAIFMGNTLFSAGWQPNTLDLQGNSKNRAMSIYAYDLDGDGVEELITGWSNGKIDARSSRTGEVMFKDNLNHAVAGITEGDYRMLGRSDLICCSVEGEGYNMSGEVGIRTSGVGPGTLSVEQDNFREILSKKQTLLLELRNYQGSAQFSNPAQGHTQDKQIISQEAKTRLQTGISINMGKDHIPPHVEITLSTNNDMIIRAVLVFAEGIFKGETHVIHPKDSEVSSKLNVALFPQKDVPIDIHIKSLVGCKGSQHYHVFELTRQLPRFSMYTLTTESSQPCDSFVSCFINERLQRIAMWLNQNFLLSEDLEVSFELKVSFLSLRNNSELTVTMFPDGRLVINTEDIVLAGELIQSLAAFLNLEHVQVVAGFPLQYRRLEELMQKVIALKEARLRLGAEMADHSGLIRSLVVRAEDARMMDNMLVQFFLLRFTKRFKKQEPLIHILYDELKKLGLANPTNKKAADLLKKLKTSCSSLSDKE